MGYITDSQLGDLVTRITTKLNALNLAAAAAFRGGLAIADTPTGNGFWLPTESGTYTNAGSIVVDLTDGLTVLAYDGTTWTAVVVPIDLSDYTLQADFEKILPNFRESKNLADPSEFIAGRVNSNGTFSPSANSAGIGFIPIPGNTKITISGIDGLSSALTRYVVKDSGGTVLIAVAGLGAGNSSPITFTSPNEAGLTLAVTMSGATASGTAITNGTSKFFNQFMITESAEAVIPFDPFNKLLLKMPYKSVYVATDGSDADGNGSKEKPYRTISRAYSDLVWNDGEIIVRGGDYISENYSLINSTVSRFSEVKLKAHNNEIVRIISGQHITAATLEAGYTKVYKADNPYTLPTGTLVIWQHDIDDENTEITLANRHPVHGNLTYRMPSTKIVKAANLADIEASSEPKWFNVGTTIYFSKVAGSDIVDNPIIIPQVEGYMTAYRNVENIKFLYRDLLINSKTDFLRVESLFNTRSAFVFVTGAESNLIECRAAGSKNDGFNINFNSKVKEIDCWAHDNDDEGSSSHNVSEVSRLRGLYEHNVSGITDVHSAKVKMDGVLVLNGGDITFTFSLNTGQNIGNATLINCVTDGSITANLADRVKAYNCKATGGFGVNIITI